MSLCGLRPLPAGDTALPTHKGDYQSVLGVGRNRQLRYSRNRYLGLTVPSEPVPEPAPRGIMWSRQSVASRFRDSLRILAGMMITEYQLHSLGPEISLLWDSSEWLHHLISVYSSLFSYRIWL